MNTNRTATSSTMQEWSAFLQVLSQNKDNRQPLLKSSGDAEKLIGHLKQELRKQPVYTSFVLRYKRGKQLALTL